MHSVKRMSMERLTVYPVFLVKHASHDAGSETASWIEGTTSVIYANQLGNEKSEANANRCNERCYR